MRYRFSKPVFQEIVNLIRPALESNTYREIPVSPEDQVLIATRFYATGSFQKLIGDYINVSTATVCRIIERVSEQLAGLRRDVIDMPKDETQFPGVMYVSSHREVKSENYIETERAISQ
ncbi:hypothetical protein NQ317_001089 [Molorchus minor]|uniref:Nuclease HARBI1 n=1 Tax=Molorchus minor TaxID=1323400 RepID=A0ABQ9JQ07_9CUCU|nr:hypothetical protein NQ317_001089 [Molorchus minor]